MDLESLSDNTFFRVLTRRYRDLWARAARENLLCCVPQSVSLGSDDLRRKDMENAILVPLQTRGEFRTLTGKRLSIVGCEVTTGKGFKKKLTATILSTQQVPIDGFRGASLGGDWGEDASQHVTVFFLNRPLEGGIDAPGAVDDMTRDDVNRFVAMMRAFPENQVIFLTLKRFVKDVKALAKKSALGTYEPSLRMGVRRHLDAAVEMLMQTPSFRTTKPDTAAWQRRQLTQILESHVMSSLHDTVFAWLQEVHAAETERLERILSSMLSLTQSDLHVKREFQCDLTEAVERLGGVSDCRTPLEKLHCLRDTTQRISAAVEKQLVAIGVNLDDVELSADDMLDLLLYTIIQAAPRHRSALLFVNLDYILRFHFVNSNTSALGYALATFQQAVEWFSHREEGAAAAGGGSGSGVGGGGGGVGVGAGDSSTVDGSVSSSSERPPRHRTSSATRIPSADDGQDDRTRRRRRRRASDHHHQATLDAVDGILSARTSMSSPGAGEGGVRPRRASASESEGELSGFIPSFGSPDSRGRSLSLTGAKEWLKSPGGASTSSFHHAYISSLVPSSFDAGPEKDDLSTSFVTRLIGPPTPQRTPVATGRGSGEAPSPASDPEWGT